MEASRPSQATYHLTSKEEESTILLKISNNSKARRTKPKHPCSKGHHNPLAEHPKKSCWFLYPHLRPDHHKKSEYHLAESKSAEEPFKEPETSQAYYSAQLFLKTNLDTSNIHLPVLDSGATHHIVNDSAYLLNSKPISLNIGTGNKNYSLHATEIGEATIVNQLGQDL